MKEYEVGSSGCAGLPRNETESRNWKMGEVVPLLPLLTDASVGGVLADAPEDDDELDEWDANVVSLLLLSSLVVE